MSSARPSADAPERHDMVGRRLRIERERRQVGVREFSRRIGVSPSLISQIETGKARPSVSTLYAIVNELGISFDELINGDSTGSARTRRASAKDASNSGSPASTPVQRAADRAAITLESGVRWERLTAGPDPDVDFLYLIYDVGGVSSEDERLLRHPGKEYGFVISGRLEVTIGFERYELAPGDSISYDSPVPHRLRTIGDQPVHAVWFVVGRRAGEDTHA